MAVSGNEICTIEYKKGDVATKALEKFYKNLEKHSVTVGIHKEEGAKQVGNNGFTLIQNACIQEFGNTQIVQKTRRFKSPFTGKWFTIKKGAKLNIPPRVFVRIFNDKKEKQDLTVAFKESINAYHIKNDPTLVFEDIGHYAKWQMRWRIDDKKVKPKNKEMTKEYKGSDTPLYMTGELYFGIESKVH